MRENDAPACAHLRVEEHHSGPNNYTVTRTWWECRDCKFEFVPLAYTGHVEAENARLKANADVEAAREECARILEKFHSTTAVTAPMAQHQIINIDLSGLVEKIRALPSTGALDRLIVGAYLAAAQRLRDVEAPFRLDESNNRVPLTVKESCEALAVEMLSLTPADAQAALDRALDKATNRAYDEMERIEPCGHLFANIQPNGCLVCMALNEARLEEARGLTAMYIVSNAIEPDQRRTETLKAFRERIAELEAAREKKP